MLVKRAIIVIAVGALLIAGVAFGKKAVKPTAGCETGQQQVKPERADFLAQLREAYDKQDMEAIGNIITQMEQRRDQMQQKRAEFMEKMRNFDPNDPNFVPGRGMRRPGMRGWNRGEGEFRGPRGGKQWQKEKCPFADGEPCDVNSVGCTIKHKKGRCGPKPPPPPVDEEIIEQ